MSETRHDVYTCVTAKGTVLWKCSCGAEDTVPTEADIPAPHSMQERRRAA